MKSKNRSIARGTATAFPKPLNVEIPAAVVEKFGRLLDHFSIPREAMGKLIIDELLLGGFDPIEGFWETFYTFPSHAAAKAAAAKLWASGVRSAHTLTYRGRNGVEYEKEFERPPGKVSREVRRA